MLNSTALLLDSNIRNSVCTPAKLPCRRVVEGKKILMMNNNSTFFNEPIIMAIIQQDENSNTSRRRVVESSECFSGYYAMRDLLYINASDWRSTVVE
jgi:hypothetical protein